MSSSYNVPGQLMLQGSVGRGEELEVGMMLMLLLLRVMMLKRRNNVMMMT